MKEQNKINVSGLPVNLQSCMGFMQQLSFYYFLWVYHQKNGIILHV